MSASRLILGCMVLGTLAFSTSARPQTISVGAPAPDLGKVVSATTGDTIFTISANTGAVTVSGSGARVSSGSTRAIVTLTCPNVGACNTKDVDVVISTIGSPTGRARALTNFTAASGTATIKSGPTGTNPVTLTLDPIGRNGSKFFYIGADFPIAGDNSGLPTGTATASFQVSASAASVDISDTGLAVATVFRPIVVGLTSNLSFGIVTRPREGSGSVTLNAATGNRTVTGTGAEGINVPPTSRAAFSVSGEGGQTISIYVPSTFVMTGSGSDLTVTTNDTASGTQTLSSAIGSTGTYSFKVGGSFPTTDNMSTGTYTGSFTVMVQYN